MLGRAGEQSVLATLGSRPRGLLWAAVTLVAQGCKAQRGCCNLTGGT